MKGKRKNPNLFQAANCDPATILAIRLRAIKSGSTMSELLDQMVQATFPDDLREARKNFKEDAPREKKKAGAPVAEEAAAAS